MSRVFPWLGFSLACPPLPTQKRQLKFALKFGMLAITKVSQAFMPCTWCQTSCQRLQTSRAAWWPCCTLAILPTVWPALDIRANPWQLTNPNWQLDAMKVIWRRNTLAGGTAHPPSSEDQDGLRDQPDVCWMMVHGMPFQWVKRANTSSSCAMESWRTPTANTLPSTMSPPSRPSKSKFYKIDWLRKYRFLGNIFNLFCLFSYFPSPLPFPLGNGWAQAP